MHFRHPEVLYFLFLLIIPILVHIFQLKRFEKTFFSNVDFLQKLLIKTRKSSQLKKWLILITRMIIFSCLVLAFSQPYLSNSKYKNKKNHVFIYLDNSLSTNAKCKKGNLLQTAVKDIIENTNNKITYSLLTNTNFYENISYQDLKNSLLKIEKTSKQISINNIFFKIKGIKNKTKTLNKVILISDFQNFKVNDFDIDKSYLHFVKLFAEKNNNIYIDSVYIDSFNSKNQKINVIIKNIGKNENNIPISIFNRNELLSKQTFNFKKDETKKTTFLIPRINNILGIIKIYSDDTFLFDNTFFFSINYLKKINILSIGKNNKFLSKIYTKDKFNFFSTDQKHLNYNIIDKQQLIILNELDNLSEPLLLSIIKFSKNGGSLIIIPSKKSTINSLNYLFEKLSIGKVLKKENDTIKITKINFSHPIIKNVFNKKVYNFQYPIIKSNFLTSFYKSTNIISFEDNTGFIKQVNNNKSPIYWFSAPINKNNSNFINSPLIVPIFYNIGIQSMQTPKLFYRTGSENTIDISTKTDNKDILKIENEHTSFIPLQQYYYNKIRISTKNKPYKAGFYSIIQVKDTLKTIAYNYPKNESYLNFLHIKKFNKKIKFSNSISKVLKDINNNNKIFWIWKWFILLAIVFLLLEIFILKFFKV